MAGPSWLISHHGQPQEAIAALSPWATDLRSPGPEAGSHGQQAGLSSSGHAQGVCTDIGVGRVAGCWVLRTGRDPWGWTRPDRGPRPAPQAQGASVCKARARQP